MSIITIKLEDKKKRVIQLFCLLSLAVPSILVKFTSKSSVALDLINQALIIASKFENEKEFVILGIQLHLLAGSIIIDKNTEHEQILAPNELCAANKLMVRVSSDQIISDIITIDVAYLNAYYLYKIMKRMKITDLHLKKSENNRHIMQYINQAAIHVVSRGPEYYVCKGKIILLKVKVQLFLREKVSSQDFNNLRTVIGYFHENNLKKLDMVANYVYAKLRLR